MIDEQELADLTASVLSRGIRQPIRVWFVAAENVYRIIAGERRYRAALAAKLTVMPCLVQDVPTAGATLDGKQILVEQVVENW